MNPNVGRPLSRGYTPPSLKLAGRKEKSVKCENEFNIFFALLLAIRIT
jgi:hypothetical protein